MAAVAPPSDQAADLMQKLSLDSQSKTLEVSEPVKKHASVDSGNFANGTAKPFEQSTTPPAHQELVDPNMWFHPESYFYGYDPQLQQWDQQYQVDPSVYGDDASVLYPSGYGYQYGMYPPQGSVVADGPLYGHQQYQYPNYFPSLAANGGPYNPNPTSTSQVELSASVGTDQVPFPVEPLKGNSKNLTNGGGMNVNNNGSKPQKQNYQNSALSSNGSYGRNNGSMGFSSLGYDPRFGFGSQGLWLDPSNFTDGQSKNVGLSPLSHINNLSSGRNQPFVPFMGMHLPRGPTGMGFMGATNPNTRFYGQYGNTYRTGSGYGSNGYNHQQTNGRSYSGIKSKGRSSSFYGYGNENTDGMNELNRGPRGKGFKNQKGQNIPLNGINNEENLPLIPNREQYNKDDFPVDYEDAKFFIIKSYSEDDVHKSIKYSVWASTSNGNKKLDAAYREAQEKSVRTPIFLLFSVNTSGQFVGLAEMVGQVDFNKSMEYWQQDKWNGWFPLKWHIVKDVPNNLLKHITLENNENKPVTNSRDTQEVKFEQGTQILKIFKGHSSKTCILDDFGFYEARQKTMQEKKAKQQQFHKQVLDLKSSDDTRTDYKESLVEKLRTQKIPEGVSILTKECAKAAVTNDKDESVGKQLTQKIPEVVVTILTKERESATGAVEANVELKLLEENGSTIAIANDSPRGDEKSVENTEMTIVSNGVVANAC